MAWCGLARVVRWNGVQTLGFRATMLTEGIRKRASRASSFPPPAMKADQQLGLACVKRSGGVEIAQTKWVSGPSVSCGTSVCKPYDLFVVGAQNSLCFAVRQLVLGYLRRKLFF
ncbi:hypothetical protein OESDEN_00434 [Oesophagostomum dentatum]|uniref:Uncharacterized protein n=1 Tax=Oesophagostomum dentatum TaxID=61180 RepID=A0A0B1TW03_OESDE|nr:hypothetical protein OESDEN_00434 [Oesophagostomum dentatum]